jgi:hypothetical protein
MNSSRNGVPVQSGAERGRRGGADRDLLAVAVIFWAVSLGRVVGAIARHEAFGAESTLALMVTLAIPWIIFRSERPLRTRKS